MERPAIQWLVRSFSSYDERNEAKHRHHSCGNVRKGSTRYLQYGTVRIV